jgi:hypothetical protein
MAPCCQNLSVRAGERRTRQKRAHMLIHDTDQLVLVRIGRCLDPKVFVIQLNVVPSRAFAKAKVVEERTEALAGAQCMGRDLKSSTDSGSMAYNTKTGNSSPPTTHSSQRGG